MYSIGEMHATKRKGKKKEEICRIMSIQGVSFLFFFE
jgi:hypothetical protein